MTRLWIENEIEASREFNALFQDLSAALSPVFDGREVVFHDGGGRFAPVVRDGRVHIVIDGAPVSRSNHRDMIRTLGHQGSARLVRCYKISADHEFPRVGSSRSSELQTYRTWCNTAIVQRLDDNFFILVRPVRAGSRDIDAEFTTNILVNSLVNFLFGNDTELRFHVRRAETIDESLLRQLTRTDARFSALVEIARTYHRRQVLARLRNGLRRNSDDGIEGRIRELRGTRAAATNHIVDLTSRRDEYRARRRNDKVFDHEVALATRIRDEILAIAALPQVVGVTKHMRDGNQGLSVSFSAMLLGKPGRTTRVLQPMTVHFPIGTRHNRPELVASSSPLYAAHPHRRHGFCLGNIEGRLHEELAKGNVFVAVQLMIGYLQSYNTDDSWGRLGTTWPAFTGIEVMAGNRIRLEPYERPNEAIESAVDF